MSIKTKAIDLKLNNVIDSDGWGTLKKIVKLELSTSTIVFVTFEDGKVLGAGIDTELTVQQ